MGINLGMNLVDVAIITLIGLSGVIGMRRGLTREALSLGVWGAIFLAALFIKDFTELARQLAGPELSQLPSTMVFALFLALLLILGVVLGVLLRYFVQLVGLRELDRIAGAMFGILRGVVMLALIAIYLPPLLQLDDWAAWQNSSMVGLLLEMEDWLVQTGVRFYDMLRAWLSDAGDPSQLIPEIGA